LVNIEDRREMQDTQGSLDIAIRRAQRNLFNVQYPDGYWWGELESNATMEAEYLLLTYFLDVADKKRWHKLANHIMSQQREDGTWGQFYGAPGDLSTTVECYFALKLAGISPDEPHMRKARDFILSRGTPRDTGIHQDMASSLWPVGLEGCACDSG
jgi:squalene-hopene/tetraprenyl-beta-curcumene cyclase